MSQSKPNLFFQAQTLIFLDWDDTIFPCTELFQKRNYSRKTREWQECLGRRHLGQGDAPDFLVDVQVISFNSKKSSSLSHTNFCASMVNMCQYHKTAWFLSHNQSDSPTEMFFLQRGIGGSTALNEACGLQ